MMYSISKIKWGIALLLLALTACKKDKTQTEESISYPTPYSITVPKGFPRPYLSATNPLTVEGIQLGRMLYSDSILSTNGRSCTTCHIPDYSFSSPLFRSWSGLTISVPPHVNLAFKNLYNWEGSQGSLDTLAMGDFEPEFFNTNPELLYQKLKAHPIYPDLFRKAFGIEDLNQVSYHELKKYISKAIAQFLRSRVSAGTKFDKYRNHLATLDQNEYEGFVIFFSEKGDCFHCHAEPLMSDQLPHNNGVSATYSGFDKGYFNITGNESDMGKFITPSLRNIELTAPYMHDGRFKTLEEVVDFYNEGVHDNVYVDPLMTKLNGQRQLNLTPLQKFQLVAFLKTLTDTEYLNY